jgi:hypothetical protein
LGLSQLMQPAFRATYADRVYWLLDSLGIFDALLNFMPLSTGIDALLFILPILILIYPSNRIYAWLFLIMFSLYFAAYNVSATHQEHTLVSGALGISLLLCFKDPLRFSSIFNALRYYACFIMASAAFWKIGRASLWHDGQMISILKTQHSGLLIAQDDTLYGNWIQFLIDNPFAANSLWWAAVLLELVFIIGFFTKKADLLLFIAFWLFLLSDYFVMGLQFWELGVLTVLFIRKFGRYLD